MIVPISARERIVVESFFQVAEEHLGLNTREAWIQAAIEGRTALGELAMAPEDMEGYIKERLLGNEPARPKKTTEEFIAEQKEQGQQFADALAGDIPNLSTETLIQSRIRITLALALNQTFAANNDAERGIPLELLQNNVLLYANLQQKIHDELVKRGVPDL